MREAKKKGHTPASFDEWKLTDDNKRHRVVSDDIERYPTTTTTPTTTTATTIESKAEKLPASHRFIPPTIDEVRAYCAENGYTVDADRFVDYYTSNGWKVGKNPMKDWKAAVRTWNGKEKSNGKIEHEPLWTVGTTV